jgi:L-seryl-tRNA(Ser) seleniumtransferase
MMSGDKLLGGPQAGIIVGKSYAIERLKKDPFARAMRVDMMTIAALGATLALYRDPAHALAEIPTLAMITASANAIRERCERIAGELRVRSILAEVVETAASVGAGAFPTHEIPSFGLALAGNAGEIERTLRTGEPPVIGHISDDRVILDLRSVAPAADSTLTSAILRAIA